jgi:hypothetical protein
MEINCYQKQPVTTQRCQLPIHNARHNVLTYVSGYIHSSREQTAVLGMSCNGEAQLHACEVPMQL